MAKKCKTTSKTNPSIWMQKKPQRNTHSRNICLFFLGYFLYFMSFFGHAPIISNVRIDFLDPETGLVPLYITGQFLHPGFETCSEGLELRPIFQPHPPCSPHSFGTLVIYFKASRRAPPACVTFHVMAKQKRCAVLKT